MEGFRFILEVIVLAAKSTSLAGSETSVSDIGVVDIAIADIGISDSDSDSSIGAGAEAELSEACPLNNELSENNSLPCLETNC